MNLLERFLNSRSSSSAARRSSLWVSSTIARKFVAALDMWRVLETLFELRSINGSFSWNRRFINLFTERIKPWSLSLKTNRALGMDERWNKEHQDCSNALKAVIKSAPCLKDPDLIQEFHSCTDAPKIEICAVLTQLFSGTQVLSEFFPRKSAFAEINGTIVHRETLGVLEGRLHFRSNSFDMKMTIYTDQKAIVYLLHKDTPGRFQTTS